MPSFLRSLMNWQRQPPGNDDADQSAPLREPPSPTQAAEPSPTIQPIVPDYELLRRIGRGAYGEVWLARNQATGALRAAKIVWRHTFEDGRPFQREFAGIQRFERISREHPSQLALFHIGRNEPGGYFYYVMELADPISVGDDVRSLTSQESEIRNPKSEIKSEPPHVGSYNPHTLRADLEKGRLPAAKVLEIGLALSEALSHLHSNGLVHRDVKPSNVIFVNGRPKLADIGLVTDASDQCSIVGTEGYLPPEGPGTPQADIFALGKVLYEATTGLDRRSFPDFPPDVRSWPDVEQVFELNEIVLKACAQDAKGRYKTCEEMHEDLALLGHGKSVKQKRTRQQRTRTAWAIVRAAAIIVATAACGIFLWQTLTQQSGPAIVPINEQAASEYRVGYSQLRQGTAEGFRSAAAAFTAAIQAEPKTVSPRAGLFEAYLMDEEHGVPPIAGRSTKLNELSAALTQIAPTNAETHAARAIVLFLNEGKWSEAENEFQQALNADPGCLMALTYYGYFLTCLGRTAEARQMLERARILDPTSPLITKFLGHCEFAQRQYTNALTLYLRASKLEPASPSGFYWAGRAYLAVTNYLLAMDQFEQWEINQGMDSSVAKQKYDSFREVLSNGSERGYWLKRLEMAKADASSSPYLYAEIYARLGDKEQALHWLETAVSKHDSRDRLLADEFWGEFRDEPRFNKILDEAGFPNAMKAEGGK
jgi:serine/threonine protein kinase